MIGLQEFDTETQIRIALYAIQLFTLAFYWIIVPQNRRFGTAQTYFIALFAMAAAASYALFVPAVQDVVALYFDLIKHLTAMLAVVINMIVYTLLGPLLCRGRLCVRMGYGFLMQGLLYLTEGITFCIAYPVSDGLILQEYSTASHIGQLAVPLIFLALTTITANFVHRIERRERLKINTLVLLVTAAQIMMLFGLWKANPDVVQSGLFILVILCTAVTIVTDFLIYDAMTVTFEEQRSGLELQLLQKQQRLAYEYYQPVLEHMRRMTEYRHDVKTSCRSSICWCKTRSGRSELSVR